MTRRKNYQSDNQLLMTYDQSDDKGLLFFISWLQSVQDKLAFITVGAV